MSIKNKDPELELLQNLKKEMPVLVQLLEECSDHWNYEDPIYRFYHGSYKVYFLQNTTLKIVEKFQGLLPDVPLNEFFMTIVKEGTGKIFNQEDNTRWLEATRPILEAFFHAKYFLEMAVKYGQELEHPPELMPSGWAAFLYLYNLR